MNTNNIYYPKGTINPIEKKTITKVINIDTISIEASVLRSIYSIDLP